MALSSALLHDIQVHLRLNVAVQMVHPFELHSTQFAFIWGFSSVYALVVSQVVAGAELLVAEIASVASCLVFTSHMSAKIG